MSETKVQKDIQLHIGGTPQTRLFRNNTGTGWQGRSARRGNTMILQDARPLHAGLCVGSSDLIGWKSIVITPEMIGEKIAVFVALEVKESKKAKASPEQENFISQVQIAGGFAGVCYSVEGAKEIIKG